MTNIVHVVVFVANSTSQNRQKAAFPRKCAVSTVCHRFWFPWCAVAAYQRHYSRRWQRMRG